MADPACGAGAAGDPDLSAAADLTGILPAGGPAPNSELWGAEEEDRRMGSCTRKGGLKETSIFNHLH